jgi:hypothetical protein
MKKHRRWWILVVVVIVVAAGVTAGVLWFGRSKTPTVRYLTATAATGTISKTVQADFTLVSAQDAAALTAGVSASSSTSTGSTTSSSTSASSSSSSSTSTVSSSQTGVVTELALRPGQHPRTLRRLLSVSGTPQFAFVSSSPLWEDLSTSLSSGTQTTNVTALQRALKAGGYYSGSVDGDFTSATATAFEAWQADHGMSQTGIVDITRFVWVPKGAAIDAWQVNVGSQLSGQTALATVDFPRNLVAQALITQADIASLRVGQKAQLTIDGYAGDAFTGAIRYIDDQPSSGTSSTGSSSSTEYSITLKPRKMPRLARSGMTGTLEVVIAQRKNVLLVPTSAVSGTSSVSYVRVMMNGKPAYRQVQTGMATSAYTQITGGLTAGEVVITGQYSNAASSTTSGASGLGGLGGFGGGTFRRSSGTGGSSGGFPGAPGGGQ